MAEKADKKPESDKKEAPRSDHDSKDKKKGGGLFAKVPVMLGGVMIIEAAVLFAGFKFLGSGSPAPAAGADLAEHDATAGDSGHESAGGHDEKSDASKDESGKDSKPKVDPKKPVAIPVLDFKAPNKLSGRTFVYDLSISVVTRGKFQAQVESAIQEKKPLIQDRLRTIIAQSDPEKLGGASEPGLETLRRQVKYQLDEIIGHDMIDEVLIPKCMPFRTDY